ncbi:hypothetical protein HZB94_03360 [Candidatus Falkowbacteria bacterium]|nr:hypothetical protein [Candidatus Falkowbacteria bacterium]
MRPEFSSNVLSQRDRQRLTIGDVVLVYSSERAGFRGRILRKQEGLPTSLTRPTARGIYYENLEYIVFIGAVVELESVEKKPEDRGLRVRCHDSDTGGQEFSADIFSRKDQQRLANGDIVLVYQASRHRACARILLNK